MPDAHAPLDPLDPVLLAEQLVAIPSVSGSEQAVVTHLDQLLAGRGWHTERIALGDGREDLYATSHAAPEVVLSTHVDTVPPFIAPHREGGRLWGRGSCDAKGIAAAMICAAEQLRERGAPVALLFVVGEETAHDGAHAADEWAGRPASIRALVNGEPTESTLALGTKGALRATLRTAGVAAHSAYPHLGRSATMALVRLLGELDAREWPSDALLGDTTINVGGLAGGVADNVIAPWAEARIMARLVTPADDVMRRLRDWVGDRAQVEEGVSVPPVRLGTVPGFDTSVVAFATDIPALGRWGTPYLYGPGSIHVAHTDGEFIDETELRGAVGAYERLVDAILGAPDAGNGKGEETPADG